MAREDRYLVLEDGTIWKGKALGSDQFRLGELVFNTSMTGYQEILTDNSYCGQIVLLTYPLIGNYGINRQDFESIEPTCFGLVIKDYCPYPSNWRSRENLEEFLEKEGIAAITGVDTRALVRKIREKGTMKARFAGPDENLDEVVKELQAGDLLHDQVSRVSPKKTYPVPNRGKKVVVMDFGAKLGIIRELSLRGCDIIIVPYNTSLEAILDFEPEGIVLTNGPGNPQDIPEAVETVRELMQSGIPMFGICLGHQLIALAGGAKTYKMKFGHRGANHPVVFLEDGHVEITSQNHGYAVDGESLKNTGFIETHRALNDGSNEGIKHQSLPVFSVQFHPEANAGPEDSKDLFDHFMKLIENQNKEGNEGLKRRRDSKGAM